MTEEKARFEQAGNLTVKHMKFLIQEFGKSLNKEKMDEWWGTDKDIWNEMGKRFLMWCNSHRKKLLNSAERKR